MSCYKWDVDYFVNGHNGTSIMKGTLTKDKKKQQHKISIGTEIYHK